MRLIVLPALFLTLTAGMCSHTPPAPIMVPVPQPCVTGELPAEPALVTNQLTGNSGRDIGIIAASAIELRVWGRVLTQLLSVCRASPSANLGSLPSTRD